MIQLTIKQMIEGTGFDHQIREIEDPPPITSDDEDLLVEKTSDRKRLFYKYES